MSKLDVILRSHGPSAVQRIVSSSKPILTEVTDVACAQTQDNMTRKFLAENYQGRMETTAKIEIERLVLMAYLAGVDHVCDIAYKFQAALVDDRSRGQVRRAYLNIADINRDSETKDKRDRLKTLDLRVV